MLLLELLLTLEAALPVYRELLLQRQVLALLPRVVFVDRALGAALELAYALHALTGII